MRERVVIVGYGNELRKDDGLGPRVARALAEQQPGMHCLAIPQLTPDLCPLLAKVDMAIFIDAVNDPDAAAVTVDRLGMTSDDDLHSHVSDPTSLLVLAEVFYGRRPDAWLVKIPGADFDLGDELSDKGSAMERCALRKVLELITKSDS